MLSSKFEVSLEFYCNSFYCIKKITKGKVINIIIDINCHIVLHEKMESKNTIKMGRINSAEDSPNHIPLKARPLLLLKYLDIVVDEV